MRTNLYSVDSYITVEYDQIVPSENTQLEHSTF